MAMAESLPPDASTASTGLGIRYIGDDHSYAFSGVINTPDSETTLLEFQIGGHYINSKIQVNNGSGSNDDFRYKIYLNDQIVSQWYYSAAANIPEPAMPVILIIPPFARLKVTAENISAGDPRAQTAVFSGRVYGAA